MQICRKTILVVLSVFLLAFIVRQHYECRQLEMHKCVYYCESEIIQYLDGKEDVIYSIENVRMVDGIFWEEGMLAVTYEEENYRVLELNWKTNMVEKYDLGARYNPQYVNVGKEIIAFLDADDQICIYDKNKNYMINTEIVCEKNGYAFRNEEELYYVDQDNVLYRINQNGKTAIMENVDAVRISDDKRKLLIKGMPRGRLHLNDKLYVYDIKNEEISNSLSRATLQGTIDDIKFNADGQTIIYSVWIDDGFTFDKYKIYIWDIQKNRKMKIKEYRGTSPDL